MLTPPRLPRFAGLSSSDHPPAPPTPPRFAPSPSSPAVSPFRPPLPVTRQPIRAQSHRSRYLQVTCFIPILSESRLPDGAEAIPTPATGMHPPHHVVHILPHILGLRRDSQSRSRTPAVGHLANAESTGLPVVGVNRLQHVVCADPREHALITQFRRPGGLRAPHPLSHCPDL
ncbi:hypothetical protein C8R43DRAFT_1141358 [Mycena crocata]|nr:hypothetical protein C8R43DRAFT_1141358 [Mycena crocata]